MALHLHLQNMPHKAVNLDIRSFFIDFDIPPGGVQIVGGDDGDAFITFEDQRDLLGAMSQNEKYLLGNKVNLRIVNTSEMEQVIKRCLELKSRKMSPSRDEYRHRAKVKKVEATPYQSDRSPHLKRKRSRTPPWLKIARNDDELEVIEVKRRRAHDSDNGFDRSRYSDVREERRRDTDSSRYPGSIPMASIAQSFGLKVGPEKEDHRSRDRKYQYNRVTDEERDIRDKQRYSPERRATNIEESRVRREPPWIAPEVKRDTVMSTARREPSWTDLMDRRESSPLTVRREPSWIDPEDQRASDMPRMRRESTWTEEEDRRDTSMQREDREPSWSDTDIGGFGQTEQSMGMEPYFPQALPYPHEDIREERWMNWDSNMDTSDAGDYILDQGAVHDQIEQDYEQGSHTTPGFIRMSNVSKFVTYKNIRQYFMGYMIEQGGIILKPDNHNPDFVVACIQFVHINDALVFDNRQGMIQGQEVVTKLISLREYENFSKKTDRSTFATPGYAMISDLPPTVRTRDIKDYLKEYNVGRIFFRSNEANDSSTAFILFKNLDDVQRCDGTRGFIHGKNVKIDKISHSVYGNNASSMKMSQETRIDELQNSDVDRGMKFLTFHGLPTFMTAWGVWKTLGGPHGPCKGVLLVSQRAESGVVSKTAYGAYDNNNPCFLAKAKDANVKPLNEKGLGLKLIWLGPGAKIFKASSSGRKEIVSHEKIIELRQYYFPNGEQGVPLTNSQREDKTLAAKRFSKYLFGDCPFEGNTKKITMPPAGMYFLGLAGLPEDATACKIWKKFGGSKGPCTGVILLSLQKDGSTAGKFAYAAYNNGVKRNIEKTKHESAISMRANGLYYKVMSKVNNFDVTIFRSSPSGKDEMLSTEGVKRKFFQHPEVGVPLTEAQLEQRQQAAIEVSKYLFESQAMEDPNKSKVQPDAPLEYILKLTELPWNVTACEIWNWFDGPQGSSTGVTLVCKSSKGADSAVLANVAFKDIMSRKQAKAEHPEARTYSALATYRHLAKFGPQFDIFMSTVEGKDRLMTKEERLALRQKYIPDQVVVGETADQDKLGAAKPSVEIKGDSQSEKQDAKMVKKEK